MKINFSQNDVNSFLNQSSNIKNRISKNRSAYNSVSANSLAIELWNDIIDEYCRTVPAAEAGDFSLSDISISEPISTDFGVDLKIEVSPEALHRYSLRIGSDSSDRYTGSGVYDIFGLITRGYSARSSVVGFWVDRHGVAKESGYITSLRKRSPNPFIKDAVSAFESRHADVTVDLPELWS